MNTILMTNRPIRVLFFLVFLAGVMLGATDIVYAQDRPKSEPGFAALFDGKSLDGWEGNTELWSARDGMIVGDSPGIKQNEFLATKKEYGDFELRLEFKLHNGTGNTGIQFRSKRLPDSSAVEGYQADIGQRFWGCLYDEHRRRKVLVQAPEELNKVLKKDDWNTYLIRAQGDHILMVVNGIRTVDYHEPDDSIARKGIIALQVHSGPAMRIDFRNIRLREITE